MWAGAAAGAAGEGTPGRALHDGAICVEKWWAGPAGAVGMETTSGEWGSSVWERSVRRWGGMKGGVSMADDECTCECEAALRR